MVLENKTILVTGGTGSFGKKFVEVALKHHNPKAIRVFSRSELNQFQMQQEIKDERIRYFIGDVREKDRLCRAMYGVDILVHAAALKQVCACEYNPMEAVKTNILGTANVIETAIDNGVEKAIFISSDKAVSPVNFYGATKLCAEKLFIQANSYASKRKTKFSCSRYGNVVGSRGSVVPLFFEQRKNGTLTLTDRRMTRFWITLGEGVNFVINCLERMRGGEIFIPKTPSIKIIDLTEIIGGPETKVETIGIRPGEKINEVLFTPEEVRHSKEFDNYFVIEPEHPFWEEIDFGGKSLPDKFQYRSDTNGWWLTKEEIKKTLDELSS